ncbi:SH3 domain-containing protein [Archangium lansingense]|uniref:SH3 domain-containing protein n=1 Tax=Archangium lansingense TaxID=2995310 RepID=UPI003B817ABA
MSQPVLFTSRGERLALGPEMGRGGEGAVYVLPKDPQRVAKVYLTAPPAEQGRKLEWMAAHAPKGVEKLAAWPHEVLHEGRAGGPVRGFTMPRVNGLKPIHLLYSTASRRKEFPTADWAFLVQTALNCASVFEELHAVGHLVGDVNESNLLVSPRDATVRLIDCDSFQIRAENWVFHCEVGVPLFTPPELQGQSFRGVERTPSQEGFSLAVLLFHLLFLGRHPFTGVFTGQGEMTPERAIGEFRFAYGRNARALQMTPPAIHLPLATLTPELIGLFERAFAPDSPRVGRPGATEWYRALQALARSLRSCAQEPTHKYPQHLPACPWCQMMATRGVAFFSAPGNTAPGPRDFTCSFQEIESLWAESQRLLAPNLATPVQALPMPALPDRLPVELQSEVDRVRQSSVAMLVGGVLATVGWWVMMLASPKVGGLLLVPGGTLLGSASVMWWLSRKYQRLPAQVAEQQELLHQAELGQAAAQGEFERFKEDLNRLAERARQLLHGLRAEYSRLQPEFEAEQRRQLQHRETLQREQFLRSALIEDHEIDGIKQALKSNLVRWGIESAYDVLKEDVKQVPGFGEVRTTRLVAWAKEVEKGFRFDPSLAVSEAERRALVSHFLQRKASLRSRLEAEVAPLRKWSQEMTKSSGELATKLEGAQQAVVRATLGMPAARPAVEAALKPPVWEDRRVLLGMIMAVVLGGLAGLVSRATGTAEPVKVALPPAALEQVAPEGSAEAAVLPLDCLAREQATTGAPVLERLAAGSRLEVVAEEGGWRKVVLTGGREGWTGPNCWPPP